MTSAEEGDDGLVRELDALVAARELAVGGGGGDRALRVERPVRRAVDRQTSDREAVARASRAAGDGGEGALQPLRAVADDRGFLAARSTGLGAAGFRSVLRQRADLVPVPLGGNTQGAADRKPLLRSPSLRGRGRQRAGAAGSARQRRAGCEGRGRGRTAARRVAGSACRGRPHRDRRPQTTRAAALAARPLAHRALRHLHDPRSRRQQ